MKKTAVLAVFWLMLLQGVSLADDFFEAQLNSGIRNSDVRAYQVMQEARDDRPQAVGLLRDAVKYSPDLPAAYFALAKENFSLTSSGVLTTVDYLLAGIDAYSRNFWWTFSLAGGVFYGLVLSFLLVMLIIAAIRCVSDLPLVAHEMGESKRQSIILLPLFVLSLMSPLLFLAGLLVILGLYMSKIDRVVVYAFLIVLFFSPVIFRTASLFPDVSSSGRMKAIVTVNESRDNAYALAALKGEDMPAALFSYALALKRSGLYHEALSVYQHLVKLHPDARTYVNIGNTYTGMNSLPEALQSYLAAVTMRPLASAYYNLSAVSRELLDYEMGNEYYRRAIELDRNAVSRYQNTAARTPNRIVADETLSLPELWDLARKSGGRTATFDLAVLPLWTNALCALLLAVAFHFLATRARNRAYRCRKCNSIFCSRCEKHIMWGQMCPQCFRSLIKLDETEVKERVARLLKIYGYQKRRRGILKTLSFTVPGASQIFGGKVLYGFLFMWPFLFLLILPFTNALMSPGPGMRHWPVDGLSLLLAAMVYVLSNIITRQRIAKGWL